MFLVKLDPTSQENGNKERN